MTSRIPIALALLYIEKNHWKKIFLVFLLIIITYGIILSGSRGGLLSVSLALILFALFQKNKAAGVALISVIFVLGLLIMPEDVKTRIGINDVSASSDLGNSTDRRLTYQVYGAELFQEHPILGIGLDGFAEAYAQSEYRFLIHTQELRVAHNTYLEIATGTGVVGLIPFLGILGSAIVLALRYSQKKYREISSDLTIISIGLFASLGGYYLGMFFGSRQYEKTLWFLLALPIILQILIDAKEKRSINPEQIQKKY
jgi:O-antigen ligase